MRCARLHAKFHSNDILFSLFRFLFSFSINIYDSLFIFFFHSLCDNKFDMFTTDLWPNRQPNGIHIWFSTLALSFHSQKLYIIFPISECARCLEFKAEFSAWKVIGLSTKKNMVYINIKANRKVRCVRLAIEIVANKINIFSSISERFKMRAN